MSDGDLYAKVSNLELVNEFVALKAKYDKAIAFIRRVERIPFLYSTIDDQALILLEELGEAE